MKKIFLTSGLILCMACPAMAATDLTYANNTWTPSMGDDNTNCIDTYLGTSQDGATVTFDPIFGANTYTITYKPGTAGARTVGGDNVVKSVLFEGTTYSDQTALQTLAANTFNIDGYTFVNWSSDHNVISGEATTTPYNATTPISPYKVVGNTEMTAIWTPNKYTVTYNAGTHGSGSYTHTDGATYDANYIVPEDANNAITAATGYTFRGWNTVTDQTQTNFPDASATPWTRTSDLTVYAVYTANQTVVSYNCGASISNPAVNGTWTNPAGWTGASQTVTYDLAASHPAGASVCSLNGYTFARWNCVTGTTGSTTDGLAGDGIANGNWAVDNANVTCTAVWTQNTIGLTWKDAAGQPIDTTGTDAASCDYDGAITLPTSPSKDGYTFKGWTVATVTPATGN